MENQYNELVKVLTKIGKETANSYKKSLKEKKKIATGKLYNSIDFKLVSDESGIKLFFVAEKYWINIEHGRKPNSKMPPVEVIERWLKSRNIKPKDGSIKQAAFAISRSIGKRGIKPNPFLANIKKNLSSYTDEIKEALSKDLKIKIKDIGNSLKFAGGNSSIQFKTK